jgi:hypothetical protein
LGGRRIATIAYFIARIVAAFVLGPMLIMTEFWIAAVLDWKWLNYALIVPARMIQGWLERHGVMTPQVGGDMPDLGFVFALNSAVNIVVFLILFFRYPKLLSGFFNPLRENA